MKASASGEDSLLIFHACNAAATDPGPWHFHPPKATIPPPITLPTLQLLNIGFVSRDLLVEAIRVMVLEVVVGFIF